MVHNPDLFRAEILQAIPNLKLLILFGSRAKGTAREHSDWDLAILSADGSELTSDPWGELGLYEKLGHILQVSSDQIDLVNLNHCSPLLKYAVALQGKVLYEAEPNLFIDFQRQAWHIYLDTAKLRAYEQEYIRRGLENLKQ
ncbi:type VII toxin-antitoxin system MntA family adenylyltransferase antitoxin [Leptolyngbya sp. FACHB-261]|uniref:type VII toxin-antitoxin system MntA family adenylyltransferase antitoxin n=1 Tax=Leptolyngbya sp. FACHB-261 TaxID=2692806 RepID=UPI0016880BDD|nr:nucleotidyltransferase domain-containing protein [Leptolyngbya sp. FACHB-261]MBD2102390.1 nucleotidyltransferase domain-containing protein [Leptolyngbya sp. FACHB-261]